MEYSEGFNPHQKMSFAQPLGVGILSDGEYLDAEIADGQDPDVIRDSLNGVCGDGFFIVSVKEVQEGAKKAMAALVYAGYHVDLRVLASEYTFDQTDPSAVSFETVITQATSELLACSEIFVEKPVKINTKKRSRARSAEGDAPPAKTDIRPQIIRLSYEDGFLNMLVTAGSNNNLKPDTLLKVLFDKTKVDYDREKVTIIRTDLYAENCICLEQFQTV